MITRPAEFQHSAFPYHGDDQFVDGVSQFVTEGLEADEPVLVAVPTGNLAILRDALADTASAITWADMAVVGRNPKRILAVENDFAARHPGRRVHMVGEVLWPGRTPEAYPGCVKHEALTNIAFAGRSARGLCPCNAAALPGSVIADMCRAHPLLWGAGGNAPCAGYAPDEVLHRYNQPLPRDPGSITYLVAEAADLSRARAFATGYAHAHNLSPARIADLALIVTELATNSLQHGGGSCRLALWEAGGQLICQASDGGRFDNPLAGRLPPPADSIGGWGLFTINEIADLVCMHLTPVGTTIQVHLSLVAPDPAECAGVEP